MSYFPRDEMVPLVSVLIPTRGRPELLRRALQSIRQPGYEVEILVRGDSDDPKGDEIEKIVLQYGDLFVRRPRGRGYGDLHLMYDELASVATGDWLWMLNDDVEVLTENWADVVAAAVPPPGFGGGPRVCLMNCLEAVPGGLRESPIFPMIRREAYLHLSRFSGNAYNDLWLNAVYLRLNACMRVPITVRHLRDEMPHTDDAVQSQKQHGGAALEQWRTQDGEVLAEVAKLRELL